MLTCTFEDGASNNFRHAVTGALVIDQGKILLVRRAAHLHTCPNKWGIPGGYVDLHERITAAALREIFEETGYQAQIDQLFLVNDRPHRKQEDRENVEFTYLVHPLKQVGQPDQETAAIHWFPLGALPPANDFAFDHLEEIKRYREYLRHPVPLPILNFDY